MEQCLICHNKDSIIYYKENEKILQCTICKSIFNETTIDTESSYFTQNSKITLMESIHKRFWKLFSNEYFSYLKSNANLKIKSALDIGTGYGHLVKDLNSLGIQTLGIESNKKLIVNGVTDEIIHDYFDEHYRSEKKFDLICMTNMIYYLRNIDLVLQNVKSMLTEHGQIFIVTTNPESKFIHNELKPYINSHSANMIVSKYYFEKLGSNMGLELKDYSLYRSDLLINFLTKNKFFILKYLLKIYPSYVRDSDGFHAFIILQKT